MSVSVRGSSSPSLFVEVSFIALVFVGAILFPRPAYAMGQAPTGCPNWYSGTIVAAALTYPGGSVDLLQHPNSNLTIPANESYNVSVTIRTSATNSQGSTQNGSVWYSQDIFGYDDGSCLVDYRGTTWNSQANASLSIEPNSNVSIVTAGIVPPPTYTVGASGPYQYSWYTYGTNRAALPFVVYNVDWVVPNSSSTSSASSIEQGTRSVSSSQSTFSTGASSSLPSIQRAASSSTSTSTENPLQGSSVPSSSSTAASSSSSSSFGLSTTDQEAAAAIGAVALLIVAGVGIMRRRVSSMR